MIKITKLIIIIILLIIPCESLQCQPTQTKKECKRMKKKYSIERSAQAFQQSEREAWKIMNDKIIEEIAKEKEENDNSPLDTVIKKVIIPVKNEGPIERFLSNFKKSISKFKL